MSLAKAVEELTPSIEVRGFVFEKCFPVSMLKGTLRLQTNKFRRLWNYNLNGLAMEESRV